MALPVDGLHLLEPKALEDAQQFAAGALAVLAVDCAGTGYVTGGESLNQRHVLFG